MSIVGAHRFKGATHAVNATTVIAALMLLAVPIRASHHFANHFRTSEARRTVERHLFLQDTPADADGAAFAIPWDQGTPPEVRFETREPLPKLEDVFLEVPLTRLFLRLKINPGGTQDSFLHL